MENNKKICCHCKYFKNSTHFCTCNHQQKSCKDTCMYFTLDIPIDWEQRRYEIAKEVLPVLRSEYNDEKEMARVAVIMADYLINELKERN